MALHPATVTRILEEHGMSWTRETVDGGLQVDQSYSQVVDGVRVFCTEWVDVPMGSFPELYDFLGY